MKKQNQLAVIQSTSTVVIPKPTKTEVIAALVAVAKKEHEAKAAAHVKEKEQAEAAFRAHLQAHLAASPALVRSLVGNADLDTWSGGTVRIGFSGDAKAFSLGADGKALLARWHKIDSEYVGYFNEKVAKQRITQQLYGMEDKSLRVEKLAASPEVAALYAAISK